MAATACAFGLATPASAVPLPPGNTVGVGLPSNNFVDAFAKGLLAPDAAPIGANNWNCKPSAAHPRPVVLAHGTWENAYNAWSGLSPILANEGYCVFALNYGKSTLVEKGGLGEIVPGVNGNALIEDSAKEFAVFVDAVLAHTGTAQVDVVAASQGGLVARQYLKFEGGANAADPSKNKIKTLVTLGATNHGTGFMGLATLDRAIRDLTGIDLDPLLYYIGGTGPIQQVFDSQLLLKLNADGDTVPGVDYTIIGTRYDEVSNPYEWTFLEAGRGATVANITLQDGCGVDVSDHLSMVYSPRAIDWIKHALDPATFPESKVRCVGNSPIGGRSDGGPLGPRTYGSGPADSGSSGS